MIVKEIDYFVVGCITSLLLISVSKDEINEYLDENDIHIDETELDDSDYEIIEENLDEIMNDEEIEYMEYPDMICINSLYYVFHK